MPHGVLSLADFLGLRLDHAGEVLGCDFGRGGDGVRSPSISTQAMRLTGPLSPESGEED